MTEAHTGGNPITWKATKQILCGFLTVVGAGALPGIFYDRNDHSQKNVRDFLSGEI